LLFPTLGGETDLSVEPREPGSRDTAMRGAAIPPQAVSRVASASHVAAGAVRFLRESGEFPSGLAAFDAVYEVFVRSDQVGQSLVDPQLAVRILRWPAGAVAAHSMLIWRDAFGLHVQARLASPPNWTTVSYLLDLADDVAGRVPPAVPVSAPTGLLDRLVARLLRS